jgi:hypothetical protein
MELVDGVVDFGNAPEMSVDGVARVTRVSPNKIRVSYFTRHIGPGGRVENRIVLHTDWDVTVWLLAVALGEEIRKTLLGEPIVTEAGLVRVKVATVRRH